MTTPQQIFGNTIGAIHLPCMRILYAIRLKIAGETDMISFVINHAVQRNTPAVNICQTIAEMANDNYNAIADLIGVKLTDELLTIFHNHLIEFNANRGTSLPATTTGA